MRKTRPRAKTMILLLLSTAMAFTADSAGAADPLDACNVVWTTPSKDHNGSMPIGNGDLAANVWVEPSGDLVFYISKSDAWSGNGRLLKLGRVRVKLDAPLFKPGMTFKQELDLEKGVIRITGGTPTPPGGRDEARTTLAVAFWIDANHPVIHVEVEGDKAFNATATLELWRTGRRPLAKHEANSARGLMGGPPVFVEADVVMPSNDNVIRWYHRNEKSCYPVTLEKQHLGHLLEKYPDPLINRTFGALMTAEGMIRKDDKKLITEKPVEKLHLKVYALTEQADTVDEWSSALGKLRADVDRTPMNKARNRHNEYWRAFWDRSWIFAAGDKNAEAVTRAYVLQRWVQACAGRGKYPIKFNGSLFTVASYEKIGGGAGTVDADYRRWGGCYWFQNTRLSYWPMLYAGDFDQMEPFWKLYRDAVPILKDRVKAYYNHDGICLSETMYFWGTLGNVDFGWNNKSVHPKNSYIRYYWDSGIELSMMMLDCYSMTQDKTFLKDTLLPIADNVVIFYDQHYKRNAEGKVHFSPAMVLETWHRAEDPSPIIVGLRTVLTRLLELPETLTHDKARKRWQRFLGELPAVTFGEKDGMKWIEPARTYSNKANSENTALYAVFPYREYTQFKPDLDVALETWGRRPTQSTGGWRQDSIQAALLGLTKEAVRDVARNALSKHGGSRFPAFWGPNMDWVPHQDHGGVTMIALQRMLMQIEGEKIHLLAAWPKEWNCRFKLHAPGRTVLEGTVVAGKVTELNVTPASRRKDVVVGAPRFGKGLLEGRPVTATSSSAIYSPEKAVDGNIALGSSWWAENYPQSLTIDLEAAHDLNRIKVFPYWGAGRYYQYTVEVSMDGATWRQVGDMSKNTTPSTSKGSSFSFEPVTVRYVRVNMLYHNLNKGVHLVEVQAFEADKK